MVSPKVQIVVSTSDQMTGPMAEMSSKAVAGLDTFAMAIQQTGATIGQLGSQVSGYLDGINKSFFDLEMKTAEAATILGEAGGGFEAVAADVDKVSESMGNAVSKVELATAAYDVYSVGITDAGDRLQALELASMASIGGVTDTATAVKAGAGAMNAFGMTVDDLNTVYDIQFNLVEKGVITYEQLANVSGRVNAAASQAGQSLQVTSAALAAVTQTGIPAQQAAFRTQAAFLALQRVSAGNREELAKLGIHILDSAGNYNSMVDIINQTKAATEGLSDVQTTEILQLIATDSRAQSGFTSLMKMSESFTELSTTIDEAGSLQEKYNIITETSAFQLEQMNNRILDAKAAIGEDLTPATMFCEETTAKFYESIAGINPELVKYGGGLLMIAGRTMETIGPIMQMVGSIVMLTTMKKMLAVANIQGAAAENIGTLAKIKATIAQWALNTSLYGCPLIWIVAAIVGVVAVLIILEKKFGLVTTAVNLVSDGIKWLWEKIKVAFNIGEKLYNMGKEILNRFIDGIKDAFAEAGDVLGDIAGGIAGFFGGSLPERGPLKHIVEYGEDLIKGYTKGMERVSVEGRLENITTNIIQPTTAEPLAIATGSAATTENTTIINNYILDFDEFMDKFHEKSKDMAHSESISI